VRAEVDIDSTLDPLNLLLGLTETSFDCQFDILAQVSVSNFDLGPVFNQIDDFTSTEFAGHSKVVRL
jgi:hypothetical protein